MTPSPLPPPSSPSSSFPTIKGVLAHQSLWGEFDMLHSPLIGIMELISTCYSIQLVSGRLLLHPQSSPPSPTSMYGNKHCSSGFLHPLIHISFIPNSYFSVWERIHMLAAPLQIVLLCIFDMDVIVGLWREYIKNGKFCSNWCVCFLLMMLRGNYWLIFYAFVCVSLLCWVDPTVFCEKEKRKRFFSQLRV